ncbi:MAG: histidine phosphatase family protein [Xanthobacteraceae bacterium]|nr:histidine phosphatase family protein [Xanthobacteraceae bacterium]
MPSPTIYFIRHGETAWNAAGRFQGTQDIPLNDLGHAQATHAGGVLGELIARNGHAFDRLAFIASPLIRARRTMELVREALALPADGFVLDDRLREIAYGVWEGSTLSEMRASHPELFAMRERDKWNVSPPGGESYVAVTRRMRDWYRQLAADTVAVSHGGTARALMVALGVATPATAADLFIEQGAVYVFSDGALAKYD